MTMVRFEIDESAGDAERRQRRGFRIGARRLPCNLDGKAAGCAFGFDLVHVSRRIRIGDQFNLRGLEADARKRDGGGHVGILRIAQSRLAGGAAIEHGARHVSLSRSATFSAGEPRHAAGGFRDR